MKVLGAVLLLGLLSTVGILAADSSSPASGGPATGEQVVGGSSLQKKVTYAAERKSLAVIMEDVSRLTGTRLRAGSDCYDWRVRDRKMSVFVKDVPLADLMGSIARVMKLRWAKDKDQSSEPTYLLYMDLKTLREALAQAHGEEERIRAERSHKRAAEVNALSDLGRLTDEEKAKLRESDPWGYVLASSGVAGSLGTFLGMSAQIRSMLASGQNGRFRLADMSPDAQRALLDAIRALWQLNSQLGQYARCPGFDGKVPLPKDLADHLGGMALEVNGMVASQGEDVASRALLGDIRIGYDSVFTGTDGNPYAADDFVSLDLYDRDSSYAKGIGNLAANALEGGPSIDEQLSSGAGISVKPSEMLPGDIEPSVAHEDDPALDVKVVLKAKEDAKAPNSYTGVLASVSKSTAFSVISDDFGNQIALHFPDQWRLRPLLDAISMYGYNWWKYDSRLEFRDRRWAKKLLLLIPDQWLDQWRNRFVKDRTLFIDDLSAIAKLTDSQFEYNLAPDPVLGQAQLADIYRGYRDPLKLYAELDGSQRKALFSEAGVPARSLRADQWRVIERIVAGVRPSVLETYGQDNLSFVATWEAKGVRVSYTIGAVRTDDRTPVGIVWPISTPEYMEVGKKGVQE
jgi:hypothetical protein